MNDLPKINRNFLSLISDEVQEEIARQTEQEEPGMAWLCLALVVVLAVFVVLYPILMVLR